MKALAILALLIPLAGCAEVAQRVSAVADDKRAYNDGKARLLLQGTCDMSVGAYHRVLNGREQQAISVLCGGDDEPVRGLPE